MHLSQRNAHVFTDFTHNSQSSSVNSETDASKVCFCQSRLSVGAKDADCGCLLQDVM